MAHVGRCLRRKEPEGVVPDKYDETPRAMVAQLKYGSGLPFHRMEKLEQGDGESRVHRARRNRLGRLDGVYRGSSREECGSKTKVRHLPQSGWFDDLGRLKGGWLLDLGVARCPP